MDTRLGGLTLATALVVLVGCGGGGDEALERTFTDGFTSPATWPQRNVEGEAYGTTEEHYLIALKKANRRVLVAPEEVFGSNRNSDVEESIQKVEARGAEQAANPVMGVVCRWNREAGDALTAYVFTVEDRDRGPGWTITRYVEGKRTTLKGGQRELNIIQPVRLESRCEGSTLTFLVNGAEVGKVEDSEVESGINGLFVLSPEGDKNEPPMGVRFDNYELKY